ncbi:CBS domain-containing protein [Nostoc sp. CMAA1605]|uniref:CBS domain-containing protein n=1 Tax=Nostoc sp. CMAA1605 TaxID=2055159 RepID=UPI001F3A40A6|nr:CBS domain-containing protein [Nostoc sp. CMAA1605]MCF4968089.1 PAS domain S-box protein [Nostoc sp. CMAA1605]
MNLIYAVDLPTLEQVMEDAPLTVTSDRLLIDVIDLMNRVGVDRSLGAGNSPQQPQVSCILIVEGKRLIGIFTLKDVVRVIASGQNLSGVRIGEVMTKQVITLTPTPEDNALTALLFMGHHRIRHLPIVNAKGELVGLITQDGIRQVIEPAHWLKFRTVAEVMVTQVVHAPPTASLRELAQIMSDRQISCVVIVTQKPGDRHLCPVGMVTERDMVSFQLQALDIDRTPAEVVMSRPVCSVSASDFLMRVQELMQQRGVRRVVVVGEQGELQGLVTQTNLLQMLNPSEMLGVMHTLQQKCHEQTIQLQTANQQLQQEVNQRQQVEVSLKQAQVELELRVAERTAELVQANAHLHREIAERQQAQSALEESEQRLQLALSATNTGIWDWNLQTNQVIWSENIFPLFDLDPQTFVRNLQSFLNCIHSEDREFVEDSLKQAIDDQTLCDVEFRTVWRDGTVHWGNGKGKAFYDQTGQPLRMIGVHQDITSRKQTEACLRESEQRLQAIIDNSPAIIYVKDIQGRHILVNSEFERITHLTREEVKNKTNDEIFSPEVAQALTRNDQSIIASGKPLQSEEVIELDDGLHTYLSIKFPLCDSDGCPYGICGISTDITEKKQLEQQFYHAQRLESIGTLASGIAHDLNNVFAPIVMIAQLLPIRCQNVDVRTQELFKTLETSSKRGSDLVKQILTFARGKEGQRILLQPGHLLKELVKVMKQTFPKTIEIKTDIPSNTLWIVQADPTQLDQVFMNLVVNARDAMPNGGMLTITAENHLIDETYARMHLEARAGGYVLVKVADTGTGIPPEFLERIFDPFFTTKEVGQGTGLGLSTVLGIVKNHGGFVEVSSQVGRGTEFRVFLPISTGTVTEVNIEAELPRGHGELILVADDETIIQETTQETLADYNYRTLVVSDGIEAIALYAQQPNDISVVLLDMLMPNIDGLTTIRTLKALNPQVKIIATSGLPTNEQKAIAVGATKFLSKPYTATELLQTLADVVEN